MKRQINDEFFRHGMTRNVYVFPWFVVKIPRIWYGFEANKIELNNYKKHGNERFAKLYLSLPFGLCNIMERAYIPPNMNQRLVNRLFELYFANHSFYNWCDAHYLNFGFVGRKFVCIDYA